MVTRATVYTTVDGQHFPTVELARAHEKSLVLGDAVNAALANAGLTDAVVVVAGQETPVDLKSLLLQHAEVLVVALTPPKKERKPRTPKAPQQPETPVTPETPAETKVETPEPVVGGGDDELAALLGDGGSVV